LLIELIEKEGTGRPMDLAGNLGLKERMIYNLFDDLDLPLNKDVCYYKEIKSYVLSKKTRLIARKLQWLDIMFRYYEIKFLTQNYHLVK